MHDKPLVILSERGKEVRGAFTDWPRVVFDPSSPHDGITKLVEVIEDLLEQESFKFKFKKNKKTILVHLALAMSGLLVMAFVPNLSLQLGVDSVISTTSSIKIFKLLRVI